jgi:hypothetical protein
MRKRDLILTQDSFYSGVRSVLKVLAYWSDCAFAGARGALTGPSLKRRIETGEMLEKLLSTA